MDFTARDFILSLFFHVGLLLTITLLNPFNIIMRPDFDSVGINIIEMPPLGSPELIKPEEMPEISIPQATETEDVAIPLATPETREEPVEINKPAEEKPEPKPREDTGYKGDTETSDTEQQGGTDVSDQIGPGSAFGSALVDNANFNYPTYFYRTFGKIQRNWINPVRANQPMSCFVSFQISRTGTILDPIIKQSSGVEAFDRACIRALQASNPLPPLPSEFQDDIIGITLEFPYLPR